MVVMAKIYISSTYVDLKKEREAAAKAIQRLEHQAIAMENYAAADQRPVDKCLQDVKSCDVYVGIFAWRYGFIPGGYDKSITHLEYETAKQAGIPCLIFLLDEDTPWPPKYMTNGEERQKILQLRDELKQDHLVKFFKNADQLNGLVSDAVGNLIFMAERSFSKLKSPEDLIGTRLGKYVILAKLGKGGKGVVFKVMDTLEEREKAVKMVPPRIADSPVAFKELKREINTAACIIHPHVVKVLGLEEVDGQFFIVMEYIEGQSLEQILAGCREGKLAESQVIAIMKKLALGLLETHKKNVIHRDIKPSNVMLTPDGQVKILDFGISYQVTTSMTELVGEHHRTGTWPYMAPEQLSTIYGRENKQVDIWGFGVTMYQLLTGKFPFINKDQIKDRNEKPYELAGVSRKVRNLVMKCLEKDRKNRFQNMEEVLKALNAVTMAKVKETAKAKEKGKVKKAPRLKWMLMAAAVIVLVVLSVFLFNRLMPGDKPPGKKQEQVKTDGDKPSVKKQEQVTTDGDKPTGKKPEQAKTDVPVEKPGQNDNTIDYLKDSTVEEIAKKVYQNEKGFREADLGDGIIMVYIPAGTFTMGSNDYDNDEKSPHEVLLDGYWLGKTEVTVGQYKAFISDSGHAPLSSSISKYSPGDNHPVVYVSWEDAVAYCKWLSNKKGLSFTLPTEAQWEKAARGTDQRKYPWGNHDPYYQGKWYANYKAHDSWEKRGEDGFEYTSPVGSYPQGASPYGMLDMAGNVWEWCRDWYESDYYKNSPRKNPTGPDGGASRVLRGVGWGCNAVDLRCSSRAYGRPSFRGGNVGFRLCQDNK
jgi:formylglycine-generating enzyme required for sulfatase activity/predicted Ser/Thr protein kinase